MGIKSNTKKVFFKICSRIIFLSGLYKPLINTKHGKNNIICLFYHDVSQDPSFKNTSLIIHESLFWNHINNLSKDFNIISLDDIFQEGLQLPKNALILTFDGYSKRYLSLAKQLSKKGIKALFYIHTQPIEKQEVFWRQKLYYILYQYNNDIIIDKINKLLGIEKNHIRNRKEVFNFLENLDEKESVLEKLAQDLKIDLESFIKNNMPLKPEDVREMSDLRGIEIGSHSHTHPVQENLPVEKFEDEIVKSKELLEKWTDKSIQHFAYPSGKYQKAHFIALKKQNYKSATTTERAFISLKSLSTKHYSMPRFGVHNYKYSGLIGDIIGLRKKINNFF